MNTIVVYYTFLTLTGFVASFLQRIGAAMLINAVIVTALVLA